MYVCNGSEFMIRFFDFFSKINIYAGTPIHNYICITRYLHIYLNAKGE